MNIVFVIKLPVIYTLMEGGCTATQESNYVRIIIS